MNRDMFMKLFIFTAGAAIGSAVTWNVAKTKYERIANEEIASVKRHYAYKEIGRKLTEGFVDGIKGHDEKEEKRDWTSYESYVKKYTSSENEKPEPEVKKEEEKVEKPYVISPEEFGEYDDYETISLTMYADGVLTDDQGNIIDDVDEIVGEDSLNHFGEYEDDSVFVRNDERRCDYEILADALTYEEAISI